MTLRLRPQANSAYLQLSWRAQRSWCRGMKERRPEPNTSARGGKKSQQHRTPNSKTCACTCEYCPTFRTGKHTLQMGTRCRHERLSSAVVEDVWITPCIGMHLDSSSSSSGGSLTLHQLSSQLLSQTAVPEILFFRPKIRPLFSVHLGPHKSGTILISTL